MNSCDCGNHRTGHPRCAQLIANTVNWLDPSRRTQQATLSVSPSHDCLKGFTYEASRVSPTGNFPTSPSETQDLYESSFRTGASKYRTIGTASAIPTSPLDRKS